jgi:O-antigen/teichoic acid export membrane protein
MPAALRVSALLFGLMILLTLFPALLGETSPGYWIPIALVYLVVIIFSARLVQSSTRQQDHAAMRILYLSAALGLLVFVITRFNGV